MKIELSQAEARTLLFYIEKAIIDAEGMAAIGMQSRESAKNLKSVKQKLEEGR